jgi:hypothetical protein
MCCTCTAYVHNITKYDWELLNKIVQHTGYGFVVPGYPLAPEYNYKDVYKMVVPVYEELMRRIGTNNVPYRLHNMLKIVDSPSPLKSFYYPPC